MDEATQRRIADLEARLAAQDAVIAAKDAEIARLQKQVVELLERLNRNSSNSNKPPSSDAPRNRAERRAREKGSGKQRGGQPGHKGSQRALVPASEVDKFVDHYPPECENCWRPLSETLDPSALRYQTTDLPKVRPYVEEHRFHCVGCVHCGHRTAAPYEVPPAFGPRIWALVALLTGVFHMSRRGAATLLSDVVGVEISLGALSSVEARVSDAVEPAVAEAWQRVEQGDVKHTDGTTWFQAGATRALWTIATSVATVFKILANGQGPTLKPLFGGRGGILVSDRASALAFWAMEKRQVCWAHLLRKFVSFSERGGEAGRLGNELLDYVKIMFAYWDKVKTGAMSRAEFRRRMAPLREGVEAVLRRAVATELAYVSGSCADILAHAAALWTFVDRDDVEPTNNHAERELRAFVLWRKRSFGTQSERGNLFAERLMTVAHTARKQHKNVLEFLVACCTAARTGGTTPSLFVA